jgi:hypothetical protein
MNECFREGETKGVALLLERVKGIEPSS